MLLTLETSSQTCIVTLGNEAGFKHESQVMLKTHSTVLLPIVDKLLTESNLKVSDLAGIAFSAGPGSFIGARLAASVVQGLAYAADLSVYPVSSLRVLAQSAFEHDQLQQVIVSTDAHMGDRYVGKYQCINGLMTPVIEDYACVNEAFSESEPGFTVISESPISPKAVHGLAMNAFLTEKGLAPSDALPVYLRGTSIWDRRDNANA